MANSKVTIRDVYEAIDRMETRLDKRTLEIKKCVNDNTTDITALKYWKADLMGKITMAIALLSLVFTLALEFVREKFFNK